MVLELGTDLGPTELPRRAGRRVETLSSIATERKSNMRAGSYITYLRFIYSPTEHNQIPGRRHVDAELSDPPPPITIKMHKTDRVVSLGIVSTTDYLRTQMRRVTTNRASKPPGSPCGGFLANTELLEIQLSEKLASMIQPSSSSRRSLGLVPQVYGKSDERRARRLVE